MKSNTIFPIRKKTRWGFSETQSRIPLFKFRSLTPSSFLKTLNSDTQTGKRQSFSRLGDFHMLLLPEGGKGFSMAIMNTPRSKPGTFTTQDPLKTVSIRTHRGWQEWWEVCRGWSSATWPIKRATAGGRVSEPEVAQQITSQPHQPHVSPALIVI